MAAERQEKWKKLITRCQKVWQRETTLDWYLSLSIPFDSFYQMARYCYFLMYKYRYTWKVWKVAMCICSIQSYELNVLTKYTKYTIKMAGKKNF